MAELPDLMTPGEVAAAFRVDPKTVSRWAKAGKLHSIQTPGGHYRFDRDEVEEALRMATPEPVITYDYTNPHAVIRYTDGVKTGSMWGPSADRLQAWFAYREDLNGGQPQRFSTRDFAEAFLRSEVGS